MTTREPVPLFVFGAALVSIGALSITARGLPLLWAFAAVILLSRFVRYRVVDRSMLRWFLRIMLIGTVVLLTREETNGGFEGFGPTHTRDLFGEICVAEMALQFWRWRSYDPKRSNLCILLMSGLTFLTASNTFEETFIRFIAPVYLVCIALLANGYRSRGPSSQNRRLNAASAALSGVALAVVLAAGAIAYRTTIVYRSALTDLGNRIVLKGEWASEGAGMSSQPNLGPIFGLRGSPARILRIAKFVGDEHLVGVAYDTYSGGQWGPSVGERHSDQLKTSVISASSRRGREQTDQMNVTRLVNDNPLIFLPMAAVRVDFGDENNISRSMEDGGPIRVRARAPYEYTVEVAKNDFYQGIPANPITPGERTRDLNTPSDDPEQTDPEMDEVEELAHKEFGHILDPRKRVDAVANYLLTHHGYSLVYRPSGRLHEPLADFLLSQPPKAAHCEFFASAAAMLLRYVDVPTRYVTGYFVHEVDRNGDMIVRQRDAHAWCEAWINGTGWVTVEATPVSGRPDSPIEETPVEPWRRVWEWLQDKGQALTGLLENVSLAQVGALTMALTLGVSGLIVLRSNARKRGQPSAKTEIRRYSPANSADLERFAQRFESIWSRLSGSGIPANVSYGEFFRGNEDAGRQTPAVKMRLKAFAELYDAARFGGQTASDRLGEMENLLHAMEASLD